MAATALGLVFECVTCFIVFFIQIPRPVFYSCMPKTFNPLSNLIVISEVSKPGLFLSLDVIIKCVSKKLVLFKFKTLENTLQSQEAHLREKGDSLGPSKATNIYFRQKSQYCTDVGT